MLVQITSVFFFFIDLSMLKHYPLQLLNSSAAVIVILSFAVHESYIG